MAQPRLQLLAIINLGSPTGDDLALRVSLPSGVYGVPYVGAFIASGGTEPYTYSVASGSLPTGLSLDSSTGAVTGTPTVVGRFEFTAAVTDFVSTVQSKVVAVIVNSGIVFSQVFAPGEVGIAYSSGISASGGTAPYTWTVSSGSLPTSLSINASTGVVSGTPSADGTFNFTLTATDSASNPQDFATSITIAEAVTLSGTFADGVVGVVYSAAPSLTGGVAPYSFAITSGAIPTGCSFSPTSGTVYGTCTAAATYTFDITVTDFLGGTDTSSQSVDFIDAGGSGGSGTVTDFTAGDLSPLFTTNVATSTTTPDLTFAQINQNANLVFAGPNTGAAAAPTFRALVTADIPTLPYNVSIQFKDEGSNLGTSGTVNSVNWTGGGVTATRVGDALTVNVPSGIAAAGVMYFGTGIDGDVTLDGTNTYSFLTKSGSIYTATRDLYLDNLSFGGAGQLNMVGFRLFVYGTWDPSGTSAQPSVYWPANNGANASAASLGAGGAVSSVAGQLANGCAGSNGVGGTATGTPGNPTAGASTGGSQRNNGGRGGPPSTIVASGGTGSSGSGGNSILSGVPTPFVFQLPYPNVTYMSSLGAISAIGGGGGGTGGGGASGNGVNPGGGGGGGGAGGNMVYIAARTIAVTNGLSGVAAVTGGSGGNGGTPVSGTNCGSGGGGSGGGGGLIHVVFQSLSGSGSMTVTANGGPGGNAGTPTGTGTSGKGGTGGDGGLVVLFNVGAGTATSSTANAGSAGSGATGGSGGTSIGTLTP